MPDTPLAPILSRLRGLSTAEAARSLPDAELLGSYAAGGDQGAFAAIVRRHGRLVLSVCRAVLGDADDAEDAFQATFLVLARKADSVRRGESLASWLHGVAYRVALSAKRDAGRRRKHERGASTMVAKQPGGELALRELQAVLDEELVALPERYRAAFVACCLEGLSKPEAAHRLGCPEGTLSGRLARARSLLRHRLAARGVGLSAALCAVGLAGGATAAVVPHLLVASAVRNASAALADAPGGGIVTPLVTPKVAALAEEVMRAMFLTKAKAAVPLALLAAGLLASAAAFAAHQPAADSPKGSAAGAGEIPGVKAPPADTPKSPGRVRLAGRVLDPDGKPAAGAKVHVAPGGAEADPPLRATTGKDGTFTLDVPAGLPDPRTGEAAAVLTVVATADGAGPESAAVPAGQSRDGLTLTLVRDGVPLEGRLIDLEGRPLPGVTVALRSLLAPAGGDLAGYLADVRAGKVPPQVPDLRVVCRGPLPGAEKDVTTDAEGRFRLAGLGRDRVAELDLRGPTIQHTWVTAVTRAGQPVAPAGPQRGAAVTVYPARFEHAAAPGRVVTGVVRDKGTGKPVAGLRVTGRGSTHRAETDALGRFRLLGCPKGDRYELYVTPPPGSLHFASAASVPDRPGVAALAADLEVVSGIAFRGRVVDRATGKSLGGRVVYRPLFPNSHVEGVPGADAPGAFIPPRVSVAADGTFTCPVLPGPGAVLFETPAEGYRSARVDPKTFFKAGPGGGASVHGDADVLSVDVGGGARSFVSQEGYHAVAFVDPKAGAGPLSAELVVEPGKVTGAVLGADGKPTAGTRARGLRAGGAWSELPGAEFAASDLHPDRPRWVYFRHDAKRLAGALRLAGGPADPAEVRLAPWTSVAGRVIGPGGLPLAGAEVDPGPLGARTRTDKDGRFRLEGLVPGHPYSLFVAEPRGGGARGFAAEKLILAEGEKDLGELTVKEPGTP